MMGKFMIVSWHKIWSKGHTTGVYWPLMNKNTYLEGTLSYVMKGSLCQGVECSSWLLFILSDNIDFNCVGSTREKTQQLHHAAYLHLLVQGYQISMKELLAAVLAAFINVIIVCKGQKLTWKCETHLETGKEFKLFLDWVSFLTLW